MDGVIVVDKAEGWTSHDVVSKMRRIARTKKIGHLGTLDPIATGVLPLVVGRATRLAQFYTRNDKVYDAVIRFGFATDTYDRAGTPISAEAAPELDRDRIADLLPRFTGEIQQVPPPVSAKKVAGVRAYRLARRNEAIELPPVTVNIYSLQLKEVSGSDARVVVHCSAGTYVRTLAHDLGRLAECGAHLRDLRRTASGDFGEEHARTIDQLESLAAENKLEEALIPAAKLLPEFPTVHVEGAVMAQIREGRNFPVSPFRVKQGSRYVKAVTREGELVAIGEAKLPNLYHPVVVL
jgi:tRNA pseudouridine55 synthase